MYKEIRQKRTEARQAAVTAPPPKPATKDAGFVVRPSIMPHLVSCGSLGVMWIVSVCVAISGVDGTYCACLFAFAIIWTLLKAVKTYACVMGAKYIITGDSITANLGLISRQIIRVRSSDIRSLSMRQGGIGRLFDFGDVLVFTAATGGAEIVMRWVPGPTRLLAKLEAMRPVKN